MSLIARIAAERITTIIALGTEVFVEARGGSEPLIRVRPFDLQRRLPPSL